MSKRLQIIRDGFVTLGGRRYRVSETPGMCGLDRVLVDNTGALSWDDDRLGISADRLDLFHPVTHRWVGKADPEPRKRPLGFRRSARK